MVNIKRVLYATDFSPTSDAALPYACELTRIFDAALHLIHVTEDPFHLPWSGDAHGVDLRELVETWQRDSAARLTRLAERTGLKPVTVCRMGRPAEEILQYAQEAGVDFIVVGSHGHGAFAQLLLGSVAERLIRHATCPVLTVKVPSVQPPAEAGAATVTQVRPGPGTDG